MQTTGERLAEIWCEVLGLAGEQVSLPFSAAGGTSIAAEQIAFRIHQALKVRVQGADVLTCNTLIALTHTVERLPPEC
jgi:hypothetical protein